MLFDGYPGGLNGKNTALIYSDYYFTEALLRLQNVLDGQPGWLLYSPAAGRAAVAVAPEPSTWGLMLLGFGALGVMGYRRRGREARHTKAAA